MPQVGFESTIPVFERENTVHALNRAATAIGSTVTNMKRIVSVSKLTKRLEDEDPIPYKVRNISLHPLSCPDRLKGLKIFLERSRPRG
jgi:hypothetical protein